MGIIATTSNQDELWEADREDALNLVDSSTYDEHQRYWIRVEISRAETTEELETIKLKLYANQVGIDGIVNPSQRDIKRHINALR